MTMKNNNQQQDKVRPLAHSSLDRRYGKIGILAVAAALHYSSNTKNPAHAPAVARIDERFLERAA
jgi:hypothetical protein